VLQLKDLRKLGVGEKVTVWMGIILEDLTRKGLQGGTGMADRIGENTADLLTKPL